MKKNKTTNIVAGVLMLGFICLFLILTGRFLYIQTTGEIDHVSLKEWAKDKRTTSYTISAERGKIFDKNGVALAYDRPTFRIYATVDQDISKNSKTPKHIVDPEETAELLAPLLKIKKQDLYDRLKKGLDNPKTKQIEFGSKGKGLAMKTKEAIEQLNLPGLHFIEEPIRYYPNGIFASHIIGFAQETEKEVEGKTLREIEGIAGIENASDKLLKGKDGRISYERDIYGKKLLDPKERVQLPKDGDDIYLTIDQKIQTLLEDVMSEAEKNYTPNRLIAIVMNPKTGEILAMSNRPSYNPNNPTDVKNWYNDAVSIPFEPGSTMKIFTWASAIEEGVYNGSEAYQSGTYQINERIRKVRDHNGGSGWGKISFDEGFQRSSNVAASKLVWEKMGPDTFLEYLKAFQFDQKTGIDLPGEQVGKILYNYPDEKLTTSFGQGSTFTPIQQMKAATAIANNGKMMQPFVVKKIVDPNTGEVIKEHTPKVAGEPISKETATQVLKLLESVVSGEHGTGASYGLADYSVGGKTGTAQIPNPKGKGYLTGYGNNVFSFLGMAPADDPKLMMYVAVKQPNLLTEDGYESGQAPISFIFKNVMENALRYLDIEPDKEQSKQVETVKTPNLVGKTTVEAKKILKDIGITPVIIGNGKTINQQNILSDTEILQGERMIIVSDKPKMPDITGWSLRDVLQLANLLNLKVDTAGNGYVVKQSIQAGKELKKGMPLQVKFEKPKIDKKKSINEEDS